MKKFIVALLMALMACMLVACGSAGGQDVTGQPVEKDGITNSTSAEGDMNAENGEETVENITVTNISDEKILLNEKIQQVSYSEGEEQVNPFYKKGIDEEKGACYVVHIAGQETETNIPMDNTVIYSMEDGDSYIEQVEFSYEVDGEPMQVQQYRIYINPAQE